YGHVFAANLPRIWARFYTKCFALGLYLIGSQQHGISHSMPTLTEMCLYSVWCGAMGLVDELHDTLIKVPLHKQKVPSWVFYLAYLTLLVPIPVLIMAKEVFAHFAITFAACQVLGKKLDNAVFKVTVVLGLPCVASMAWSSCDKWPLPGMAMLVIAHALYETHDESKWIERLIKKGLPSNIFAFILNFNFAINIAVIAGALPVEWLCCTTMCYPVAKTGLAMGALGLGWNPMTEDLDIVTQAQDACAFLGGTDKVLTKKRFSL
ncbi:hypothetical protein ACHAWF_005054, partial [Thalassiosira exigua]